MGTAERSKASKRMMRLIASRLKELSAVMPLKKITINDIADFCDINRSTFYYHFIDKQDAINYVYHLEVTEPLRQRIASGNHDDLSLYSLQLMYKSRDFYCQAFRIEGQNDIRSYILGEVLENWRLVSDYAVREMTPARKVNMKGIYYVSDYLASGAFSMMNTWVMGGMAEDPEEIARLMDIAATKGMLQAYSLLISEGSSQP